MIMKTATIPVEQLEKLKELVRNQTGLAIAEIDGYINSAIDLDEAEAIQAAEADNTETAPVEKEEGKGKKGKQ